MDFPDAFAVDDRIPDIDDTDFMAFCRNFMGVYHLSVGHVVSVTTG